MNIPGIQTFKQIGINTLYLGVTIAGVYAIVYIAKKTFEFLSFMYEYFTKNPYRPSLQETTFFNDRIRPFNMQLKNEITQGSVNARFVRWKEKATGLLEQFGLQNCKVLKAKDGHNYRSLLVISWLDFCPYSPWQQENGDYMYMTLRDLVDPSVGMPQPDAVV